MPSPTTAELEKMSQRLTELSLTAPKFSKVQDAYDEAILALRKLRHLVGAADALEASRQQEIKL